MCTKSARLSVFAAASLLAFGACTIDQAGDDGGFESGETSAGSTGDADMADDASSSDGGAGGNDSQDTDDGSDEGTSGDGPSDDSGGDDSGDTSTPCSEACAVIVECDPNTMYASADECATQCQGFADTASAGGPQCPAAVDALNACIGSLTCEAYTAGAMAQGDPSAPCAAESMAIAAACEDPSGGTMGSCASACQVIMQCDPMAPYGDEQQCVGACEGAMANAPNEACAGSIDMFNACIATLSCQDYLQFSVSMPGDLGVPCGAEGTQMATTCQAP